MDGSNGTHGERPHVETVGAAIARMLSELGTEVVFGIPGVHTLELFRGIDDSGMRHVLTRSEHGAVFAADGYARTSGRPGVAFLISGPGVTNATTAVAQAHHDSIPLLIVSAVVPRAVLGRGAGALHDLPDQHALMASVTAFSEHVEDAAQLPQTLQRAFDLFASERPRPVHLQIPADVLLEPAPPLHALRSRATPPSPPADALARAVNALAGAERPLILLGGGAADAGREALAVAELLQAPIAMTLNGKGAVSDEHPLSLGTTLPCAATIAAIEQADVLLAVGTELSEVDYYYYAPHPPALGSTVVQIDLDEDQLRRLAPSIGLRGDAAAVLRALAEAPTLRARTRAAEPYARAEAIRAKRAWWDRAAPLLGLVEEVDRALPHDAIVAVDSTQLAYVGQNAWTARRPRSWIVPSGWGTLGPALPLAIGAAVAHPDRPVFAVAGDGGFLYTIGEMAAAFDLRLALVVLLWNNDGYGEMRDEYDLIGAPHVGTAASAHDYLAIAAGFGWDAQRPSSRADVAGAIADAVAARRPTLIELLPQLVTP